jgi:hypothetical protein
MLDHLSRAIQRRSTPRTILVLLALTGLVNAALAACMLGTGRSDLPGGQLWYSADQAYAAIDAVGAGGRAWFAAFLAIDMLFAPLYTLLYATMIGAATARLFPHSRLAARLCLLPLLAGICDYAENAGLLALLAAYPHRLPELTAAAALATTAKWVLVSASTALATLGLVLVLAQQARLKAGQRRARLHSGRVFP